MYAHLASNETIAELCQGQTPQCLVTLPSLHRTRLLRNNDNVWDCLDELLNDDHEILIYIKQHVYEILCYMFFNLIC